MILTIKVAEEPEIVTPDGKRYAVQQENIFKPEGIDAALVKFTSNKTYSVATISKYNLSIGDGISNIETLGYLYLDFQERRKVSENYLLDTLHSEKHYFLIQTVILCLRHS
ncbi:MAG: hypothetical protein ACYTXA_26850 [Nostoc sp.]